jgi:hypothetical protein
MPRYMVQRSFPSGLAVPVADGGAEICRAVVERNTNDGVTRVYSCISAVPADPVRPRGPRGAARHLGPLPTAAAELGARPVPSTTSRSPKMSRIKSILTLAAISAATAASATGIAGAVPTAGSGLPWRSIPKPDRIAAELGAAHTSAPLYQFGLIHVRAIP